MANDREMKGKFIYEQDSINYHRFKIETHSNGAIVGSIYVQKNRDLPDKIILEREQDVGTTPDFVKRVLSKKIWH